MIPGRCQHLYSNSIYLRAQGVGGGRDPWFQEDVNTYTQIHQGTSHGQIHSRLLFIFKIMKMFFKKLKKRGLEKQKYFSGPVKVFKFWYTNQNKNRN